MFWFKTNMMEVYESGSDLDIKELDLIDESFNFSNLQKYSFFFFFEIFNQGEILGHLLGAWSRKSLLSGLWAYLLVFMGGIYRFDQANHNVPKIICRWEWVMGTY